MTAIMSEPALAQGKPRWPAADEQRFFLSSVTWQSYVAIGSALADRPGLRITYDRGNLEFMTLSRLHELYKILLSRFIDTLAEELNRPIAPGGSMTFKRQDLDRGLEGDHCFWIEQEAYMRNRPVWHPDTDPAPDLFLEIEVSRSILDRLGICAAMKIPEVWTFDGNDIRIHQLQADGTFRISPQSRFFPEIPVGEIAQFLHVERVTDYLTTVREFRAWLRSVLRKSG